jgi:hypothetical protein
MGEQVVCGGGPRAGTAGINSVSSSKSNRPSKCLRLVTGAPWYLSNRQIHEDLGVPLYADHVRALTASFDSRLPDVGNPLVQQLGRHLG